MKTAGGKIAIFAGTTEGRLLASRIAGSQVQTDVFVATEYGKEEIPKAANLHVYDGRVDEIRMEELFREKKYDLILDATHPFAVEVTANIREAAEKTGTPLLRILRDRTNGRTNTCIADETDARTLEDDNRKKQSSGLCMEMPGETAGTEAEVAPDCRIITVENIQEAVEFLKTTEGPVFVTTGSKELSAFLALPNWETRVCARVLSMPEVVKTCADMGFYGSHLIAMQGPFSEDLNVAMMKAVHARWMVTKESGKAGGFDEKVSAAKKAGAGLVVIGRPVEEGISLADGIRYLEGHFMLENPLKESEKGIAERENIMETQKRDRSDTPENTDMCPETGVSEDSETPKSAGESRKRHVFLIGTGPGRESCLTGDAKKCLEECDLIVGASRCVRQLESFHKPVFEGYQPEKIADYLDAHPEAKVICGAMSGDTGFYSAAEKLGTVLEHRGNYTVEMVPGISSVGYFFAKIRRSWDHARLLSMHGHTANFASELKRSGRAFVLGGGEDFYEKICGQLMDLGMQGTKLFAGENLTLWDEQIFETTPEGLKDRKAPSLAVLYAEWNGIRRPLSHGLSDEVFTRGNVPMTKMEVRAVSVSKLELTENSVLYDVGAGTGSISVECAGLSDTVKVYAIEKNPEAVELLHENRRRFALTNLNIIAGTAPDALTDLPAPTHVFIGGSSGKMEEVIGLCLKKNPKARFVVNLITPESLSAVLEAVKILPVTEPDFVTLTAARSKKVGSSHLMMGQNPVWIVTFEGNDQGEK